MAGTVRSGQITAFVKDAYPFLIGITQGRNPFVQWPNGKPNVVVSPSGTTIAGPLTSVTGTPGSKTQNVRAGTTEAEPRDWFEEVHILPRQALAFGNIITQQTKDYEIYNAYKDTDISLSALVNNATPGVQTTGVSAPLTVESQTSILDSSSTSNNGGTGLGTLVKAKITALQDGLPSFNTTIDFTFTPGGILMLGVSGQRIVFVPFQYESPLDEELGFLTDIIPALDGAEQRIALRDNPRQQFNVNYVLDANERQRFQSLMMDWIDGIFGVPLWHEYVPTTSSVAVSATTIQVSGASDVDFRVGGLGVIFTDNDTFDVLNLSAVTDTLLTLSSPVANSYPQGARVMPLRTCYLRSAVTGVRYPTSVEEFRCQFLSTDNATGALSGSTAGWSTYDSHVLLDDCNVILTSMPFEFRQRVHRIDNDTGIITQTSPWDRSKRTHQKGFTARGRAAILSLRKLLLSLAGKQKAFFIPTFADDLTPVAQLSSGANTIDVANLDYVRLVKDRRPKIIMKVSFNTGAADLIRVVQSSTTVGSDERLTLDTTWPATYQVADVERIQFYEMVRFDTDRFRLTYPRIGLAQLQAPVRQVFDDNV